MFVPLHPLWAPQIGRSDWDAFMSEYLSRACEEWAGNGHGFVSTSASACFSSEPLCFFTLKRSLSYRGMKRKGHVLLFLIVMLFYACTTSVSAATPTPARFVNGFFSNTFSTLLKWVWSLPATTKTAISGRPVLKFEDGYTVETVFDGSKLGIEPFAVEVLSNGELLILDSANSNIYKISLPLSRYSRPKLVAGSTEGYTGHVDGKPREARMNHPKGFTVDDRGNIYVADAMNTAIRKISDTGVTTIAGGKSNRGGGHIDGPSEDAKFSNDFEVVYVGSSCSLFIVDRGNKAIREIQLNFDDCAYQYGSGFPLGIAVLIAAGFFGYMLAMLQRRVGTIVSSQNEPITPRKPNVPPSPYQKPPKSSGRPPLIPVNNELEKQEGFFASLGKLFTGASSSIIVVVGSLFSSSRRKHQNSLHEHQYQEQQQNTWPMQESFVIPDDDEPPSLEARTPTPQKTYAFMSKDSERTNQFRLARSYHNGWVGDTQQQQQQLHHRRHYSTGPHTYYEQSCETTNEIVFGAVQEQDGQWGKVEMKPVDYGDPMYDHHNIQSGFRYYVRKKKKEASKG